MEHHKKGHDHYQIIMNVRQSVVGKRPDGSDVSLADFYTLLNSSDASYDAADKVRDAVRQLVQSRSNSKPPEAIEARRESLHYAIEQALRWCNTEVMTADDVAYAVDAIDQSIIGAIVKREINGMAYGRG
jgi:hypothetical protein